MNFEFYNVTFQKVGSGIWVYARGDVKNNTNKDYNTAMFRLSLFDKNLLIWTGTFKVMGFRKGHTRPFEFLMEKLNHKSLEGVSRYEVYFESGY